VDFLSKDLIAEMNFTHAFNADIRPQWKVPIKNALNAVRMRHSAIGLFFIALALTACGNATSIEPHVLSAQQLSDDMTKPHEAYANGVNPAWAWGSGPELNVGVNFPSDYPDPNFVPWGVTATATTGSPARNVRVQIRKMILDVKRNGTWSRIVYYTTDSQIVGTLYTNYETNTTAPANVRKHGTDGISVKLPDAGGSFHFYTSSRFPVWFGAQEIVSRLEARLIVDDPTLPDDRSSARLLVTSGGDLWRSATQLWNGTHSNVDFAIGRFKFATNDWQPFTSHTLTTSAEINDYLAHEPALNPR